MKQLISEGVKVQMCVTSPPYWGLRDYGCDGQLGLEHTPEEYVVNMVEVFRLVRELLKDDGILWLNLGDSYAGSWGNYHPTGSGGQRHKETDRFDRPAYQDKAWRPPTSGALPNIKPKDLVGIPWMVAFALRADGWYLRQDIIWHKPNPMPESVTDRCTKSHEYIFLMSKNARYYYDREAIKEPGTLSSVARLSQDIENQEGSHRVPGKTNGTMKARGALRPHEGFNGRWDGMSKQEQCSLMRNKRSVWTIATKPYSEAHFATFPPDLITPCILAGSKPGDIVLDPFFGSGTTGEVCIKLGRQYIGCELQGEYKELIEKRTAQGGLFA
jgi:DNA modification methylase